MMTKGVLTMPSQDFFIEPLLEQMILRAQQDFADAKEAGLFIQFLHLYYSQAHLDDFDEQTTEKLYGMAASHWELMKPTAAR